MATNRIRLFGVLAVAVFALTSTAGEAGAQGLGGLAKSIRNLKPGNPIAPKAKPEVAPEVKPKAPAEKFVELDVKQFGFFLIKPDADVVNHFDLPKEGGLLVSRVKKDSPAAKAGLKENDFLVEMNGTSIPRDPAAFAKRIEGVKTGETVDVIVLRGGKRETIKGMAQVAKTASN
jgi:membrane-associated protease RseP (regulator of RpoE activity)